MALPTAHFHFANSYGQLPARFFARVQPTAARAPKLIALNKSLCRELGGSPEVLEAEAADLFSGNRLMQGSDPIAQAYAGHQFGNFSPQLGDGRAILLGEVLDLGGRRRDLVLKGAGPTPFSRRGDGRAALGPVLREYLLCEAMNALGIPTTRALAVVSTGEAVYRETPLPGAVLTRVAGSHVRVGTFEYFAMREDYEAVGTLARFVMERHYPGSLEAERPLLSLLEHVAERQIQLVARWMLVGFIHGVMNTDNVAVSGETIDYGPCAFMDNYASHAVFSSIDRGGRYAFANQPLIAQWNIARFAETLLPLLDADQAKALEAASAVVHRIPAQFERCWLQGMRAKLGLSTAEEEDERLAKDLLAAMERGNADFTLTFRKLCTAASHASGDGAVAGLFSDPELYSSWAARWRDRLSREDVPPEERAAGMAEVNPAYIPRNHRVAGVLKAAEQGDLAPFERLRSVLENPFKEEAGFSEYEAPPAEDERVRATFCGT